ncbi:Annulin [Halotydeus destructor]|nr:Annulin [Halotydeus destructor]
MSLYSSRYYSHNMGNCSTCLRRRRGRVLDEPEKSATILNPFAALTVTKVNYQLDLNGREHFTDRFAILKRNVKPKLIVRRGTSFKLTITFHKEFNRTDHLINLVFYVKDERRPSYANYTEVTLPVLPESEYRSVLVPWTSMENAWTAKLESSFRNTVNIRVDVSGNAIIGEWKLRIETMSKQKGDDSKSSVVSEDSFYLLFNPWSKKDSVYVKDEKWRKEFVLNDTGIIWRGVHNVLRPTPWNYSQFEDEVLECCVFAISHLGRLPASDRSDPVKVSRHISQIVNSLDDNGIVIGKWDNEYGGGKAPTSWTGSFSIMKQFYSTKKPVKYGQCWVFAGVTTTLCRALGIPCRPVTNYQSAHDTHLSLTVDRFFDENLEPVDKRNADSVWNFHVWNEVWMSRPDLSSSGYDGWQVIDATPQEMSDGLFRCGPTSVEAVKRGDVIKPYDTKFVFAEVNADEIYWLHQGDRQPLKLLKHKTTTIGKNISTKAIGSSEREDVTDNYKHEEKSTEEREVMLKALRLCKNLFTSYYLNEKFEDIRFELVLIDDIVIGSPFTIHLKMKNKSGKVYSVHNLFDVRSTFYTGEHYSIAKKDRQETKVAPNSETDLKLMLTYDDYSKHLIDQNSFHIAVLATVLETQFQYHASDDFRVRMPDISFEIEGDVVKGKSFTCMAYFMNPLPKTLTRGFFRIEGPGLGVPLKLPLEYNVEQGQEARVIFDLTPTAAGFKTITAKFESRELTDVDGFMNVRIGDMNNDINSNMMTSF